jgi:hypothetical protein
MVNPPVIESQTVTTPPSVTSERRSSALFSSSSVRVSWAPRISAVPAARSTPTIWPTSRSSWRRVPASRMLPGARLTWVDASIPIAPASRAARSARRTVGIA